MFQEYRPGSGRKYKRYLKYKISTPMFYILVNKLH